MNVTDFGARADMLVGQSFKILVASTIAVVECQCPAKAVLILNGLHQPRACPSCKRVYAISKTGSVNVGEVVGMPDGKPA